MEGGVALQTDLFRGGAPFREKEKTAARKVASTRTRKFSFVGAKGGIGVPTERNRVAALG